MLRKIAMDETKLGERGFHWRGKDVSRIENLSDVVFALTLSLIVARDVPDTFAGLAALWRDAIAVALCFALFLLIWRAHYIFFRRYDLEDKRTIVLNSILLFLIMALAYPMKFIAQFVVELFTGAYGNVMGVFTLNAEMGEKLISVMDLDQARWALVIYSVFYAAVFAVFAALYAHAWHHREALDLDPAEERVTRAEFANYCAHMVMSGIVILMALVLPAPLAPYAGGLYALLGVAIPISQSWANRSAGHQAGIVRDKDG